MTAVPTTVVFFRMVNVSVPWLTAPAVLVTVAVKVTGWEDVLKVAVASAAVVMAAAAVTVSEWAESVEVLKVPAPL